MTQFTVRPTQPIALHGTIGVAVPGVPHSYVAAARQLMTGLRPLLAAGSSCLAPLALLAAQVAECALKAYLSRSGDDKRLKEPSVRHNLVSLWQLAEAEGLPLQSPAPAWIELLGSLHASPYPLRYAKDVFLLAFPDPTAMVQQVEALVQTVANQLAAP